MHSSSAVWLWKNTIAVGTPCIKNAAISIYWFNDWILTKSSWNETKKRTFIWGFVFWTHGVIKQTAKSCSKSAKRCRWVKPQRASNPKIHLAIAEADEGGPFLINSKIGQFWYLNTLSTNYTASQKHESTLLHTERNFWQPTVHVQQIYFFKSYRSW